MNKKNMAQSYLVAGVAAASLLSGCGRSKPKWADSPGAKGSINLDAVKAAFQKYSQINYFEDRVNEIYEGERLVVFRSDKVNGGFKLSALEDLDGNRKVSAGDDLLFTLLVANGTATLKGAGVTSYYTSSWPYDPVSRAREYGTSSYRPGHYTHFYHWYSRPYHWGGGYYTSAPRYDEMMSHRKSYRSSSAFATQVQKNSGFERRMASKYGSGFRSAATKTSPARQSYVQKTASSHSYSSSKTSSAYGIRSTPAPKSGGFFSSRSSSSKGFSGFRSSSGFEV
jgi:hypothetical protein